MAAFGNSQVEIERLKWGRLLNGSFYLKSLKSCPSCGEHLATMGELLDATFEQIVAIMLPGLVKRPGRDQAEKRSNAVTGLIRRARATRYPDDRAEPFTLRGRARSRYKGLRRHFRTNFNLDLIWARGAFARPFGGAPCHI